MVKLFRYLLLLREQRFWGEVRLVFKDGEVAGQINVSQGFLPDNLPQPVPGTVAATRAAEAEKGLPDLFTRANQARPRVS